jgi:CubicO group peptidase (beta-lactamase class C family)
MTARVLGIVVAMACSVCGSAASATNLKPLDPAALRATVEAIAKELMLPGAMVLLRTPQGDFAFGYGATELGGTTPPRADTHFRAASNTKTMTAAVILLLAQDGKLGFDDPVSKYVEGVPNGDAITIAELLNMRSGLYNYTSTPELAESVERDPTRAWTPEELLAIAFKRLTPWRMRLIPPISLRRPRREASNPTTTHGSIPPTPIRPAASSRRRTIWPFGSRAGRRQSFQRRHPAPVARQPQAGRSE